MMFPGVYEANVLGYSSDPFSGSISQYNRKIVCVLLELEKGTTAIDLRTGQHLPVKERTKVLTFERVTSYQPYSGKIGLKMRMRSFQAVLTKRLSPLR